STPPDDVPEVPALQPGNPATIPHRQRGSSAPAPCPHRQSVWSDSYRLFWFADSLVVSCSFFSFRYTRITISPRVITRAGSPCCIWSISKASLNAFSAFARLSLQRRFSRCLKSEEINHLNDIKVI